MVLNPATSSRNNLIRSEIHLCIFVFLAIGFSFTVFQSLDAYHSQDYSYTQTSSEKDEFKFEENVVSHNQPTVTNITIPLDYYLQDDPRLITTIQNEYLNPPSDEPYNLKYGKDDLSVWQARFIRELLKDKKNGFFIECGAYNGEFLSNTLVFEKVLGWKGVLIEAYPPYYEDLLTKHRKAWTLPACLSNTKQSMKMMMKKVSKKISDQMRGRPYWKITDDPTEMQMKGESINVQCFPLFSILLALNRTRIDFLSLDVEGNELKVLRTIPWEKVEITVILVEFTHIPEGKLALSHYMEQLGYKVYIDGGTLNELQNVDYIFYHPDLLRQNDLN